MLSIKGYEGRYSATEDGHIYSHISHKELKGRLLKNGYLRVNLVDIRGKVKDFLVHRLICQTYKPHGQGCVNHIDCNKINNRPDNLEWCSYKENMEHASQNNLLENQSINITEFNKIYWIKAVIATDEQGNSFYFNSMAEAEKAGYSHSKISLCCRGKNKKHKNMTWRYA